MSLKQTQGGDALVLGDAAPGQTADAEEARHMVGRLCPLLMLAPTPAHLGTAAMVAAPTPTGTWRELLAPGVCGASRWVGAVSVGF